MADPTYNLKWLTHKFDQGDPIRYVFFYKHENNDNGQPGKYVFNQWYHSPFTVDDIEYATAAHWMMAHKALLFGDGKAFEKIVSAGNIDEVKRCGREIQGFDEIKWNKEKFKIVKTGNIHKFNQNVKLLEFLLSTNDTVIVEANPADTIWGIGMGEEHSMVENPYAWNGSNLLGFALMEVRDFLRNTGSFQYAKAPMLPPWKKYPDVDPLDMFWRTGRGEQYVMEFGRYYSGLPDREKIIYELNYPATGDWNDYYNW
jgi:ribA/ribD-fused uncharacterized protein